MERIEWMLAQLTDLLYQLAPGKGKKKTALVDWMLFAKAWEYKIRTGDIGKDAELEAMKAAFGGSKVVVSERKGSK